MATKRPKTGRKKPAKKSAAPPREPPKKPPAVASGSAGGEGDDYREKQAAISRAASARRREIGAIPDIADPARREACSKSLRLFAETYNPAAFSLGFSPDHLESIARIEEAVTLGALYAMAEPRGDGKTTRTRTAALWAIANALSRYVFVIGATGPKAEDTLDALRIFLRFLPTFAADYPEIAFPIDALEGNPVRARMQTSQGRPTSIEWTADRIVLPTVAPPANWPAHWKLRPDGMVPTSGAIISTSGLTGEGIRGSLKTLTTGEQVRPSLVILDDPQTPESARSRTQNATRIQLISADVLGMAGPGEAISAVMPCTVIERGDAIDQLTDRDKHPLWRGVRRRLLKSFPADLAAWDRYFDVYRRCALKEPPDFAEANAYYLERRDELDAGAEASWEERKKPGEISAIQSAMHLYYRDPRAFMAEYQNDPKPIDLGQIEDMTTGDVEKKVNGLARGTAPRDAVHLTAMIDVQAGILFYALAAWSADFSGSVIDYGTFPDQGRAYFRAAEARPSLRDQFPSCHDDESRIFAGLVELADQLAGRSYPREGGGELHLGRALADAGKWDKAVREACRRCAHPALFTPSKGFGIGAGNRPMANWQTKPGQRRQPDAIHWIEVPNTEGARGRLLLIDTNYWKSFVARRLLTPEMGKGSLLLYGDKDADHRLLAEHCTAEYRVETAGQGRKVEEWRARPGNPENHWWDCLVGCAVGASMLGLVWSAAAAATPGAVTLLPPAPRKKIVMSEVLAEKERAARARQPHYDPRRGRR